MRGRPSRGGWRWVASLCLLGVLVACGGDSDSGATDDIVAMDEDAPISPSPSLDREVEPAEFEANAQWVVRYGSSTGDGYEAVVALGELSTEVPRFGRRDGLLACPFDPDRDAVMAARVTVTNSSSDFAVENAAVTLSPDGTDALDYYDLAVDGDVELGVGPACQNAGDVFAVRWGSLEPGEEVTTDWYLVIRDYRTPEHPQGDAALATQLMLKVQMAEDEDANFYQVTSVRGPALTVSSLYQDGDRIPVDNDTCEGAAYAATACEFFISGEWPTDQGGD